MPVAPVVHARALHGAGHDGHDAGHDADGAYMYMPEVELAELAGVAYMYTRDEELAGDAGYAENVALAADIEHVGPVRDADSGYGQD
jgi:hypothetical protein